MAVQKYLHNFEYRVRSIADYIDSGPEFRQGFAIEPDGR